jgi:hypothetical protein
MGIRIGEPTHPWTNPNPNHDGVVESGAGRVLHLDRGGVSFDPLPRLSGISLLITSARVAELHRKSVRPDDDSDCGSSCDWDCD